MRITRVKKFKYSFLLKHWGYVLASIFLIVCFCFGMYTYEHGEQNKKENISFSNKSK